MILRCNLDGLLLPANLRLAPPALIAWDSGEAFALGAVEVMYYRLVTATQAEVLELERSGYRLLGRAEDFALHEGDAYFSPMWRAEPRKRPG